MKKVLDARNNKNKPTKKNKRVEDFWKKFYPKRKALLSKLANE